jgi:PEP-CTERM motif
MKRVLVLGVGLVLIGFAPRAFADPTVLEESHFNLNGAQYENTFAVPGLNSAGFDTATGIGTLVETFNPGVAGTYNFDAFFDHELNVPFFNEYGTVTGVPAAGQTWQIDDPLFGNDWDNTVADTLDNTNHIPGTVDNFSGACASVYDPGCANSNDDVSLAMGFSFVLAADQEAVITLDVSHTTPRSGFYLGQIHPVDAGNDTQAQIFFDGNVSIQPSSGPPPVPEPGSLVLLGTAALIAFGTFRRRFSGN